MNSKISFFLLAVFLFALIYLPKDWVDRTRSQVVSRISFVWKSVAEKSNDPVFEAGWIAKSEAIQVNQEWMEEEKRLEKQCETVAQLLKISDASKQNRDGLRRIEREKKYLEMRSLACPAQVVFREPSSWSSSLWISLGEADNRFMGRTVIAPNSPVLSRGALMGVVEYVGETQSRIRLISDAGLVLAVRAVRGGGQNRELFHLVEDLITRAQARSDLFSSKDEQERFSDILSAFKSRLSLWEEQELAKGEISGCSEPFFRSRHAILKGTGFNYDFSDETSEALDLRSGRPIGANSGAIKPLIQTGDLLVTSGLDGVFPAGIPVAIATKIATLKEGAYTYEMEARPVAGNLLDVHVVFVLPALGIAQN